MHLSVWLYEYGKYKHLTQLKPINQQRPICITYKKRFEYGKKKGVFERFNMLKMNKTTILCAYKPNN